MGVLIKCFDQADRLRIYMIRKERKYKVVALQKETRQAIMTGKINGCPDCSTVTSFLLAYSILVKDVTEKKRLLIVWLTHEISLQFQADCDTELRTTLNYTKRNQLGGDLWT